MKKVWQHVLGKPYLLYDDQKNNSSSLADDQPPIVPVSTMDNNDLIDETQIQIEGNIEPLRPKERFDECQTLEEKIFWTESELGQKIIQSRPLLAQYYKTGYLFRLMENPLWDVRLKEWLSPELGKPAGTNPPGKTGSVPYGLGLPKTDEEIETNRRMILHPPQQHPPLPMLFEEYYNQFYYYTIPDEKRYELFTKGYTIIPNIIPVPLIDAAVEAINQHILNTDLYFDCLHNEKHYKFQEKKKKDEKKSFSSFFNRNKKTMEQDQMAKEKEKEKKEGTYAENPFLGTKEKQKVRLENKNLNPVEDPYFVSGVSNDLTVLSLYYATPLHCMVESLLHGTPTQYTQKLLKEQQQGSKGSMKPPASSSSASKEDLEKQFRRPFRVAVGGAQVAYRFTQPVPGTNNQKQEYLQKNFHSITANDPVLNKAYNPIGGKAWHIDGLGRGQWGTFSFLIGIPLNDQYEEYSGNLGLHDGSHYLLQGYLKDYAREWNSTDDFNLKYSLQRTLPRPDLGEPTQIIASRGDVIIALHKVAHLGCPNYGTDVRKMLYYRVSHQKHQELRFEALDDLWIEYEGMYDLAGKPI